MHAGVVLINEADQLLLLPPAPFDTLPVQERPPHPPVVEILLGAIGPPIRAEIEGLAKGQRIERLGIQHLLRRGRTGQEQENEKS